MASVYVKGSCMSVALSYLNSAGEVLFESGKISNSVKGDANPNILIGTDFSDYFISTAGPDFYYGGQGNDTYQIGRYTDTVVEYAEGGVDTALSYLKFYELTDNVENLIVSGNNMWGVGNTQDNIIKGADGSQTLDGAGGNDVLIGGAGADTFVMRAGNGSDVIVDFEAGAGGDYVRLDNYGFVSFSDVQSHMSQNGNDVVIKLNLSENLILRDTAVSELTEANFKLPFSPKSLTQTFSDEFNNLSLYNMGDKSGTWMTTLNTLLGNEVKGRTLTGNNEKQLYTDANFTGSSKSSLGLDPFSVNSGVLTITATSVSDDISDKMYGFDYSSGALTTRKTFAQQYGYFEIRADLPDGKGLWPAFWLLPANGKWPPELDVFESLGDDSKSYHTLHTKETGSHTSDGSIAHVYDNVDGFHTYGLLWTETELIWYVDGAEVKRSETPSDMHQPMYMIANLAVGGSWPGDPEPGNLHAEMKIDYIRAYSLEPTETPALDPEPEPVASPPPVPPIQDVGEPGEPIATPIEAGSPKAFLGTARDDLFTVTNVSDIVVESVEGGVDTVRSFVSFTLAENIENLTLQGGESLVGSGNDTKNRLTGNDAESTLFGYGGDDTLYAGTQKTMLYGGSGDDLYIVKNTGDVVVELNNQGIDTVRSFVDFALGSNIENLTLQGGLDITGKGNDLNNRLTGNDGQGTLLGFAGNDTLTAGSQRTQLYGGAGDDLYVVKNADDLVVELWGEGVDTVRSSVTYTLTTNVENLTLQGVENLDGHGNALNNKIIGNSGNNNLFGGDGRDYLSGGLGNDTLSGGRDQDTFAFSTGFGHDVILDFSLMENDKIDLTSMKAKHAANIHQVGSDVLISFEDGSTLSIVNQFATSEGFLNSILWG